MRYLNWISLFGSASTLICCALPALFVSLGMGAAFVGVITFIPQLVWFSEHKEIVFGFGFVMLALSWIMYWRSKSESCPLDPQLAKTCKDARTQFPIILTLSTLLMLVGAFFAIIAPRLF